MKSPLRYPGGKTRAIQILRRYLDNNYEGRRVLLSPFLGGGSFELDCGSRGYTVHVNELFGPLATFWTVLRDTPDVLQERVRQYCPVTKETFLRLRRTILELTDPLEIAAAYFVVNRCSFSGATFCGGFSAEASEKRCNPSAINRLQRPNFASISNVDALAFLRDNPESDTAVVYADPPYYISTYVYGKDGDMHEGFDHAGLAALLRTRKDWVLSYNDCPYIRALYADCQIITESWAYGMNASKPSTEIVILPPA
jgi:DNA adenine methylase